MLSVLKRIMQISGKNRKNLISGYVFSVLEAFAIKVPIFMILFALIKIVNDTLIPKDIIVISIVLVISLVLGVVFRYFRDYNQMGCGYEIFSRGRMSLGDRIKRFPMGYFSEGNIGNLSAVITSDINFIETTGMHQLGIITTSLLSVVVTILMLAYFSPITALVITITCIIVSIGFNKLQDIAQKQSANIQSVQKDVVGTVIEYVKGMQVIKAFHLVGERQERTTKEFRRLSEAQVDYERKFIVPLTIIDSIIAMSIGIIIFISCYFVMQGKMDLAMMLMLVIFVFEIFTPISTLVSISAEVRVMEACLDRYMDVTDEEIIDEHGKEIEINNYNIEFNDVSFSYEENAVIKNMSFTAKEHTLTALVGKSGCGKTTVANLVARFWDVDKGEVRVGGVNVKDMTFDCLISNISMVFQDVYLFNDTIYNNIAFGNKKASKEEVIEACKKARCYDFIMKLDNGFETVIGEGGSTLSGGEKQRISIARAILKDAPIVLLDEATASIDPDNEAYIQEAIDELIANKTLIVIAHKLSTIKGANQILVIDDGEIVEKGNHSELVSQQGLYKELWNKRVRSRSWKIERKGE